MLWGRQIGDAATTGDVGEYRRGAAPRQMPAGRRAFCYLVTGPKAHQTVWPRLPVRENGASGPPDGKCVVRLQRRSQPEETPC